MEALVEIFRPGYPNHTAMYAKLFGAGLLLQLLINFQQQLRYFKTKPRKIYGNPLKLFGKFQLPEISEPQFVFFGITLLFSLASIVLGVYPRFFAFTALFCYFPYFCSILSLSYIQRKTNLIPFVLLVLAISPSLTADLNQSGTLWEIILIKIALAQLYFSAGLQKIRQSGLSWCSGKSLQGYLLENYLWSDRKSALLVANIPMLCSILSVLTLIFELTFWVVLFIPQLNFLYLALALFFHIGTLLTMRINYLKYLSPVYMVFFTDIAFWAKDKLGV